MAGPGSDFRKTIYILEGAVSAGASDRLRQNVANLLLAPCRRNGAAKLQSEPRSGHGDGGLFARLLTESVMLSVFGGLLGLFAWPRWLVSLSPSILPPGTIPATAPIRISDLVLWFTGGECRCLQASYSDWRRRSKPRKQIHKRRCATEPAEPAAGNGSAPA